MHQEIADVENGNLQSHLQEATHWVGILINCQAAEHEGQVEGKHQLARDWSMIPTIMGFSVLLGGASSICSREPKAVERL